VRQTYFVPVRESQAGTLALRTGRLRSGERVGLAFTSEASLLLTMGRRNEHGYARERGREYHVPTLTRCRAKGNRRFRQGISRR
jgi:hypothetical protein